MVLEHKKSSSIWLNEKQIVMKYKTRFANNLQIKKIGNRKFNEKTKSI